MKIKIHNFKDRTTGIQYQIATTEELRARAFRLASIKIEDLWTHTSSDLPKDQRSDFWQSNYFKNLDSAQKFDKLVEDLNREGAVIVSQNKAA